MNFGQAIEELKSNKRVRREGWNGKGQSLQLVQPPQSATPHEMRYDVTVGDEYTFVPGATLRPWIGIKTVDGQFMPWVPSQSDVLAEDWVLA